IALAAVVSLVAVTKRMTVAAYVRAPPIWAADQLNRGRRMYAKISTEAIMLRIPAIASGFQLTDLIRRPPVLQRTAVAMSKRSALFRFASCMRDSSGSLPPCWG